MCALIAAFRAWRANARRDARLTLELTAPVLERLDHLKRLNGAKSIGEVVKAALSLYDVVVISVEERGEEVIVRGPDGTERVLFAPKRALH